MYDRQAQTPEEACTILANTLRLVHGLLVSADGLSRIPNEIGDALERTEPFSNIKPEFPVRSRIHSLVQLCKTLLDSINEIIVTTLGTDDAETRLSRIKHVGERMRRLVMRSVG